MHQRLPIVLSTTALVVALLGATPIGHAAGILVKSVPYAKTAGFAKFAGDSTKLNGRKSSVTGAPGTVVAVAKSGKLPPTLLDLSQYYNKGDVDGLQKATASQLKALTGENITDGSLTVSDLGSKQFAKERTTSVSTAITLPAGGCKAELTANFGDGVVGDMVIGTLTNAAGAAVLPNTAAFMPSIVIKTTQGGAVPNLVVCNTGGTPLTIPAGAVFHWRLIDG